VRSKMQRPNSLSLDNFYNPLIVVTLVDELTFIFVHSKACKFLNYKRLLYTRIMLNLLNWFLFHIVKLKGVIMHT